MDDIEDIRHYYDEVYDEDSRLQVHQLERDLTWRYLDAYLPRSGHLLELGAASGAYTVDLAARGYRITAFDLSPALTARRRQKLDALGLGERVTHHVGDARDLSPLRGQVFDAALIMGPLYHLVEERDRRQMLAQAIALLKPAAPVFSAFISRYGILGDLMRAIPAWIEEEVSVRSVLERGRDPEDWPRGGFRGYFATVGEIAPLHEAVGFETLALAAVEPAIGPDDESYNRLQGRQRQRWLDLLYEIGTEPTMRGASRHLLYIGRKPLPRSSYPGTSPTG